jgi:hypothetical protein
VRYAREKQLVPERRIIDKWSHYLNENFDPIENVKNSKEVEPMLTTLWDQGWPYNYYCPETPTGGSGGHVWAGCNSTATAQLAYYWGWPDHGQGYTSYIPTTHPEYGVQSADFENTWYRYNEMVDNPQTVNKAIAEYIYHFAVNFHTDFGPDGSPTAYEVDSTYYHFKYFPYTWHYRDSMPDEQWKAIMVNYLDSACPIYYVGYISNLIEGHAFICDGYQDDDYFHFNLGWGGSSNGYYTINNIVGFNYNQSITTMICPDTLQFIYPLYAFLVVRWYYR